MKDTQPGVAVIYEWSDEDVIELTVHASNGAFSGTSTLYVEHGRLSAMATELAGFPRDVNDERSFSFGASDRNVAGGRIRMSFKCTDGAGHACAKIAMESEDTAQSVTLAIPIVPHAVDGFVTGLATIESTRGRAILPIGTLQTRWAKSGLDRWSERDEE